MGSMRVRTIPAAALAALAVAALAAPSTAQTTDEVLERHYEAIGGQDAWKQIRSMRATGTVSVMGGQIQAPFTLLQKRPGKSRFEMTMQGMELVQAYDGETAWLKAPMMGSPAPQRLPADVASQMAEQADLDGALVGWKEAGHDVELVGREAVDGRQAYKLRVTLKTGEVTHYYLDAETYLPIKWVARRTVQGQPSEFVTTLGDYRDVGGVKMPFSIQVDSPMGPQSLTFTSFDVNVAIDDAVFSMPASGPSGSGRDG